MHLGLRADKEGRTAALRVIGGFACNEGFVFSLFYLGENRAFGDGPFAFERADLWGTLACMLIALFPAVNGYFFIPNYPTVVAAINFDRTGTTKIGKYVLNHSFMMPGLVSTVVAIALGLLFIQIF